MILELWTPSSKIVSSSKAVVYLKLKSFGQNVRSKSKVNNLLKTHKMTMRGQSNRIQLPKLDQTVNLENTLNCTAYKTVSIR